MEWKDSIVSPDESHHIYQGKPIYENRFNKVMKFHHPGLAPVEDDTGSYHILLNGEEAYSKRFQRTFGFYYELAAVKSKNGWFHIDQFGNKIYDSYYAWVGNYQDEICTVRDLVGNYFHIDLKGNRLYNENYLYTGDFRDGIAVARLQDGLCIHKDKNGELVHDKKYLDLDVYHKGFARARDNNGWFHINLKGKPIYAERYAILEPFYNGFALIETLNGDKCIINESGHIVHYILKK